MFFVIHSSDEIESFRRLQSGVVNLNIGTTCPEENDRELGRHLDTKGPICPPSEDEHAAGERRDVREVKQMRNFSKELSMPELPAYKMTARPRGWSEHGRSSVYAHYQLL